MSLTIYNTMGRRRERFEPLVPDEVRIYACGPTVYDLAHVGHARAALTFDVIWRYLEYRGYRVIYVRNYTDVDDKIINRAGELGRGWESLAEEQIEAYRLDMRALGLRTPTEEPRASQHIQEMIDIIQRLMAKQVAYPVDGDVYFEVRRCPDYGKLSHRNLEEMRAGARVEVDPRKRDPLDFALWKASKPGEPVWPSPWGPGRPGWHIECSAMSMKYLGETFDIHGGGSDLIFPHHENEIAQSECATGKTFARYWIHNGFVTMDAEKMSKSLGNVLTLRGILDEVSPGALKIFLLGTHFRAPIDFSPEAMIRSSRAEERFRNALADIRRLREIPPAHVNASRDGPPLLLDQIRRAEQDFMEAMDDDFNTPRALAVLFNLVREINVSLLEAERAPDKATLDALCLAADALQRLGSVLGGLLESSLEGVSFVRTGIDVAIPESDFLAARQAVQEAAASGRPLPNDALRIILQFRDKRRQEKDWVAADRIRAWLEGVGVIVDDTQAGVRWRLKSSPT